MPLLPPKTSSYGFVDRGARHRRPAECGTSAAVVWDPRFGAHYRKIFPADERSVGAEIEHSASDGGSAFQVASVRYSALANAYRWPAVRM